jgi:Sir2- and TIR-associating SLOG family/SIR2-like domain
VTDADIPKETLIREYAEELRNYNAVVFVGAGLSRSSGYLDWRQLLAPVIRDLGLNAATDVDLVTVAQYSVNEAGGNRAGLTRSIFNAFQELKKPTRNHELLARLPIHTYWTTNYDKLIEEALKDAKKVPDVKYRREQLAVTRAHRDVVVYKMHGDVDHPHEAVICKDDYERYPWDREPFITALRGDLIEKTFLFLGFSFSDPNIDYILSRVRTEYGQNQRHHYCVLKRVTRENGEPAREFKQRALRQYYFIRDLKRFAIQTVLVDDYGKITQLLEELSDAYKRASVFISGAAAEFGSWSPARAEAFLYKLGKALAAHSLRIVTGFGIGVGSAVINGALAHLSAMGRAISDEDLVMRPFPQGSAGYHRHWKQYREGMIDYAGVALFVFGNQRDGSGTVVSSPGMREEFDLCLKAGVKPLPIGATGFLAQELWNEVQKDLDTHFPRAKPAFRATFKKLNNPKLTDDSLIDAALGLINTLRKAS